MNTNEELKTRPDFTEINRKLYLATQSNLTIQELMNLASDDVWTTHVEPLQVEMTARNEYYENKLESMQKTLDEYYNDAQKSESENQKLREQLKEKQSDLTGCTQLLNEMFAWAKVKNGRATFETSEETWSDYKKFVLNLDKTNP